jgi:putative oxidoreductase
MSSSALSFVAPLGRLCLSLIFVASAVGKMADWETPARMIADKGLPAPDAFLSMAIVLEFVGGVLVLLGFNARFGAVALLLFLVPVTLIMHNFWSVQDAAARQEQMINFMKNVSIAGGVLIVLALGPGPYSIDHRRQVKPPVAP